MIAKAIVIVIMLHGPIGGGNAVQYEKPFSAMVECTKTAERFQKKLRAGGYPHALVKCAQTNAPMTSLHPKRRKQ